MFGWRKKRDGFEWRSYVRTTILVKRKHRQDKLEEAKQAALEGLAEAGRAGKAAGQSGVEAAKRGLGSAAQEAKEAGAKIGEKVAVGARDAGQKIGQNLGKGAKAAGRAASEGAARAGAGFVKFSRIAGSNLGKASGVGLEKVAGGLSGVGRAMSPRVSLPLVIAAIAALIGGVSRTFQNGFDTVAATAGIIAGVLAILAVLPVIAGRASLKAPFSTVRYQGNEYNAGVQQTGDQSADFAGLAKGLAGLVIVGLIVGAGFLAAPFLSMQGETISLPKAPASVAETIEGKAKALTGDVMEVGGEKVVLRGIEAPEVGQSCRDRRGRRWRCGRSALSALRKITGYETIVCSVTATDAQGRKIADCKVGETNIAAALVEKGAVFAGTGFFRAYGDEEEKAKAAKRGIWKGEAKRPSEARSE